MSDDDELIRELRILAKALPEISQVTVYDAANRIEELMDEIEDTRDEAISLERDIEAMEADDGYSGALYSAIVEGRSEDAVDYLRRIFPNSDFMDVRSYHNLFPERIK